VQNFEDDFANGYALGELLWRCRMLPEFDSFVDSDHPDAKSSNFSLCEPKLRELGIKFHSGTAHQIMVGQPGTVQRLLYQLMVAVRSFERNDLGTNPASSVVQRGDDTLAVRRTNTQRAQYSDKQHAIFEQRLRELAENPNNIMQSMVVQKFEEEMIRQHTTAEDGAANSMEATLGHRAARRAHQLDAIRRNHEFLEQWEERGQQEHKKVQRRKKEVESIDLRYELSVKESSERREKYANARASATVENGIDSFEKTLRQLGIGEGDELDPKAAGEASQRMAEESPIEHFQSLNKTLIRDAGPEAMQDQASRYLKGVKDRKAEEVYARKERERRRRKAMLDQQATQKEQDDQHREKLLADKLLRQCEQERRLAARLAQARKEKELIKENRIKREEQYASQRERDYQRELALDAEMGRLKRAEMSKSLEVEAARRAEAESQRLADRTARHTALASECVGAIVELTLRAADHREFTDAPVPAKEWREWKALLIAGQPQFPPKITPEGSEVLGSNALDDEALSDYLTAAGEWASDDKSAESPNTVFGAVLQDIDQTINPPEAPAPPPPLEAGLKLVMLGKR